MLWCSTSPVEYPMRLLPKISASILRPASDRGGMSRRSGAHDVHVLQLQGMKARRVACVTQHAYLLVSVLVEPAQIWEAGVGADTVA